VKDGADAPGSGASFATSANLNSGAGFQLDDDPATAMANSISFAGLASGSYSVTELGIGNFTFQSITCSGSGVDSSPTFTTSGMTVTVTFTAGGAMTCTFHNVPPTNNGSISITKAFVGPSVTSFLQAAFTASGPGMSSFSLANGQTKTFTNLPGGNFFFTEGMVPGFTLTSITCSAGTWTPQLLTGLLSVMLSTGDSVNCVFTNTQTSGFPIVISPSAIPTVATQPPVVVTTVPSTSTSVPITVTAVPSASETVAPSTSTAVPSAPSTSVSVATAAPSASAVAGVGVPGAPATGTGQESSSSNTEMLVLLGGLAAIAAGLSYLGIRRYHR